ncbi:hypothetical protein BGZ68_002054, partial [Mortierella alpina]
MKSAAITLITVLSAAIATPFNTGTEIERCRVRAVALNTSQAAGFWSMATSCCSKSGGDSSNSEPPYQLECQLHEDEEGFLGCVKTNLKHPYKHFCTRGRRVDPVASVNPTPPPSDDECEESIMDNNWKKFVGGA